LPRLTKRSPAAVDRPELHWVRLSWVRLSWVRLSWVRLSWVWGVGDCVQPGAALGGGRSDHGRDLRTPGRVPAVVYRVWTTAPR